MKKTIALFAALLAVAAMVGAKPLLLNLNEYGTTASLTNAASGYYEIDSIYIRYPVGATNTMTFSKLTGGQEFLIATTGSITNTAAATVAVTLANRLPIYTGDVLKISTTRTNAYVLVTTKDDLR